MVPDDDNDDIASFTSQQTTAMHYRAIYINAKLNFTPQQRYSRSFLELLTAFTALLLRREPGDAPELHNGHTIQQVAHRESECCNSWAVKKQNSQPRTGSVSAVGDTACGTSCSEALSFKNNTQHSPTPSLSLPISLQQPTSGMSHPVCFHFHSQPDRHGFLDSFCALSPQLGGADFRDVLI